MRAFITTLIALFPVLGHAEVMDKEPSLTFMLLWGLVSALLVFFVARSKPLLLLVLIPAIGLFFFAQLSELMDPYIGPAIAAEAGQFYVFISWATPALVFIGGGIGLVMRCRKVKTNT